MRLFIVVYNFNVPSQIAVFTKPFQALATLMWSFFVVHSFMSLQVEFAPKRHFAVYDVANKDFLVVPLGLNVRLQTAVRFAAPRFIKGRLVNAVHVFNVYNEGVLALKNHLATGKHT